MRYLRHAPLLFWLAAVLAGSAVLAAAHGVGTSALPTSEASSARQDRSSVLALRSAMVPVLHAQRTDRDRLAATALVVRDLARTSAATTTDSGVRSHYTAITVAAEDLAQQDGDDATQDLAVAVLVSRVEELANAVTARSLGLQPASPSSPTISSTRKPESQPPAPAIERPDVSPSPSAVPDQPVAEVIDG